MGGGRRVRWRLDTMQSVLEEEPEGQQAASHPGFIGSRPVAAAHFHVLNLTRTVTVLDRRRFSLHLQRLALLLSTHLCRIPSSLRPS